MPPDRPEETRTEHTPSEFASFAGAGGVAMEGPRKTNMTKVGAPGLALAMDSLSRPRTACRRISYHEVASMRQHLSSRCFSSS